MSKKPQFDYTRCMACGICSQSCPVSSLPLTKTDIDVYKKAYPYLEDDKCIECGICADVCPLSAITMGSV